MDPNDGTAEARPPTRIAAVGDLHCTKESVGHLKPVFAAVEGRADVLLLLGDLTDYGLADEGRLFLDELVRTHPKSGAAKLAKQRIAELDKKK